MKKTNKNNNHKILNKNYIKGAISGALALTILCSGVGVAAYSAGADNTAQALGVQTESTVEAVKKASTTKEALKKLSKNETVYVIADASGAAKKIIVSDWLKGVDTKGKVKDVSNLKDVKNVKGDETYTVNEDNAYEWAANGDDIYYQGTGTTELPVKLKLSYKLNGKTVSADEIAGKSGKVTIRIDYENTQKEKVKINGKTKEVNVPFLMLSGMILDDDKFKNVEVSNGKAINDGTRTIVAGFALPGMQDSLDIDKDEMEIPDYVEITADTTDFELSTTMTVAMNDIFNDVDFSKVDDKVDELKDSLDELEDAAEQLVDGSSKLYDGIGTLLDKSGTLIEGIDRLYDGAEQVNSGAKKLDSGADGLSNGAKTLDDGAAKLKSGASQLDSGLATLAGGASQVDNGAASLSSYVATLAGGLGKLSSNSATLNGGAEQMFNKLLSTADILIAASGLKADKLTIKNYDSVLEGLISSLSDENAQKLAYNTALETVTATVNSQKDVIRTAVEATVRKSVTEQVLAAAGLGMTADQYDAAVAAGQVSEEVQAQVSTAVSTQMSTSAVQATIDSNTEAQIQSLIETNMNSEEVQSQIQAGVVKAQAGRKLLQALKTQLDSYNTFYQGLLSYTAGVDQANEGAQQILAGTYTLKDGTGSLVSGAGQLKNGSSSLKSGTSELKSGTSTLKDGTSSLKSGVKTLKNGTSSLSSGTKSLFEGVGTLKDGSAALVDGVKQLNDGAMTLSKGMKKFKEEGIDSIVDAANGDVQDIIDRFKAVQKASKKYNNYSGISDDMDGKVDFIYKTDSIEKK
jgi:putative membrane protein